jgi:hypothetical protein
MPESPSSDQTFFLNSAVGVTNTRTTEPEPEDAEDQLEEERGVQDQAFHDGVYVGKASGTVAADDAEADSREVQHEIDAVDAGGLVQSDTERSPASENDAVVAIADEMSVLNTADKLAEAEDESESYDIESEFVVQTKTCVDKSAIFDELEDKLRSIPVPVDDLDDGVNNDLATLPDGETAASDEETDEQEATEWNENADNEQTVAELPEVQEAEIEASSKQPVDFSDEQFESLCYNDQLSSYVPKESSEPDTAPDDHDTSGHLSTTNEDDTLEGRMSADTSEQIFISHMIEAANKVDSAAAAETPTNSASNETRILESTLGGIALGFDEEEIQEERLEIKPRAGLPFGILDPRSPEPDAGPYSYIGDSHYSEAVDKETYRDDESTLNFSDSEVSEHNRIAVASSPRCLVESPPDQLSPTHELALKDELSPVTEQPVTCRKKMAIGSSPSGFILEEDEEEEEELEQVNKHGFFRPIVETAISSDQPESEAEEIDPDEEQKEILETESHKVSEMKELHDVEEVDDPASESDGTASPFDVITSEDLAGYSDYENRSSSGLPVQSNATGEPRQEHGEETDEYEAKHQEGNTLLPLLIISVFLCCILRANVQM